MFAFSILPTMLLLLLPLLKYAYATSSHFVRRVELKKIRTWILSMLWGNHDAYRHSAGLFIV